MDIQEIQTYLNENKDNEDVKGFVNGFTSNVDVFKSKIDTDPAFKSFMDSEKDKHLSKGLETYKTNNLGKLVDEEVKKRFPEADPRDTEIAKLKQQFEQMQKDATHKDLTNSALKIAQERKLPTSLIDFMIGSDQDTTYANLDKLTKIFEEHDEAIKLEFAKGNSYTPPSNKGNENLSGEDKLKEQIQKAMGTFKKSK